jgi:hypothetical protein
MAGKRSCSRSVESSHRRIRNPLHQSRNQFPPTEALPAHAQVPFHCLSRSTLTESHFCLYFEPLVPPVDHGISEHHDHRMPASLYSVSGALTPGTAPRAPGIETPQVSEAPKQLHDLKYDGSILAVAMSSRHLYAGTESGEILVRMPSDPSTTR